MSTHQGRVDFCGPTLIYLGLAETACPLIKAASTSAALTAGELAAKMRVSTHQGRVDFCGDRGLERFKERLKCPLIKAASTSAAAALASP